MEWKGSARGTYAHKGLNCGGCNVHPMLYAHHEEGEEGEGGTFEAIYS